MIIGYTSGVYDLFHIGHLNILRNASTLCDKLIVGVTTDEVAFQLKNKMPIIPFEERFEIVKSIRYVDEAVPKKFVDNLDDWQELKFDIMIKGDDWKETEKGKKLVRDFSGVGVEVKYFPYTKGTSSTFLRKVLSTVEQSA